ncbi:outer membrane beta-barrel protein [Chitinophaga sancti]|uniref:outer membrane beta-barrel protein n=1 Tax=Chitinophaga sancti TaxID=1004 RepID=UPI003F7AB4E9
MKNPLSVLLFCFGKFLFLSSLQSLGQDRISGQVINKSNKSIQDVSVILFSKTDGHVLKTSITNADGHFEISSDHLLNNDLKFTHLNYDERIIHLDTEALKNGIITVLLDEASRRNLKEVQVTTRKQLIERKIDRTIFNVENSIAVIGGDAMDALSKAPGVRVGSNNSISIIGKNTIKVLINDKLIRLSGDDLVNYLKSIPAADLSRIEVITNPPSKYDAEGNSGLINIVTRKVKREGFYGNVRMNFIKTVYQSENGGVSFSYIKDRMTLTGGINGNHNRTYSTNTKRTFYPEQLWDESANKIRKNRSISGSIGLDYKINSKQLIGFQYNASFPGNDDKASSLTTVRSYEKLKPDSLITTNSLTSSRIQNHSFNIHHEIEIDTAGKGVFTDADYFYYTKGSNGIYSSYTQNDAMSDPAHMSGALNQTPQKIKLMSAQTEFRYPVRNYKLSWGAKISMIRNNSNSNFYIENADTLLLDTSRTFKFRYKENTEALFFSGNRSFGKLEVQLGLRAEYTQINGVSETYNQENEAFYLKIFPTAYFLYRFDDEQSLSLTYGRRISRPEYSRLNPFRYYSSPYSYSEGNPYLLPSYSNNFEISHNYKDLVTSQGFVSILYNGFDQIGIPDKNTNIIGIVQRNFLKVTSCGINETINTTYSSWLESYHEISVYYNSAVSSNINTPKKVDGWGAYLSTSNTITFNKKKTILGSADFWFQFPEISGVDKVESYYSLDLGLKLLLLHKKLTVIINGTDLLKTNKVYFSSITNSIVQNYGGYSGARSVRLSFSYKFGAAIKSQRKKNSVSNDSEKKRI